jgi:hypothetical protein
MAFLVSTKWTAVGMDGRNMLAHNLAVQDTSAFVNAVGEFIRGYAAMKYSRSQPDWGTQSGTGSTSWTENGNTRSVNLSIAFTTAAWKQAKSMTMIISGIGGTAVHPGPDQAANAS